MGVDLTLAIELVVVIGAEVAEVMAGEDEIDGDKDGVGDGHGGAISAPVGDEPRVLGGEERIFFLTADLAHWVRVVNRLV
ncbi:MAG: hypothetical protein FWG34_09460 [Oscillospiraceae bacterium]|nr:hypothetical protein [Oscillospiraceae bacterium]